MKHKVGDDVRGIMLLRHYEALRAKTDMWFTLYFESFA